MAVTVFIENDPDYLTWLSEHPDQWVITSHMAPTGSSSHVLHRATCHTISGTPSRGEKWTYGYLKGCGERASVYRFGEVLAGKRPEPCGQCVFSRS